jgi:AcrR family transcriptional regulator
MTPKPQPVKSGRRYDTTGRRDRAHRAHAHILTVARELFLRDGYAATTVAGIAAAAGVSVETIYKTFRGKPGLIRAIQRSGLAGAGPVPAPDRSDEMSAQDLAPRAILRHWATLTTEVMPRVAPIILLVRAAAATDPDMGRLLAEINDERLQRMHHNASQLTNHGPLRDGMSTGQARDVMFAYTAPELYEILVTHQQWPIDHYADFVYRGLVAELLDDTPPHRTIPSTGSVSTRSKTAGGAGPANSGT